MATERDIDLLLLTGAGASYGLAATPGQIAAMKEWSNHLTRALVSRPGYQALTGLELDLEGQEFEARLGKFLAAARAFRDGRDLITASAELFFSDPTLQPFNRRETLANWHDQVNHHIAQLFEVINSTLYDLFGSPSFDYQRARAAYSELLERLAIAPRSGRWVYATTNYDKIGDDVLARLGFPVAWGERLLPSGGGERVIEPYGLLDNIRTTVPTLHLHGRIGWYRRREEDGGEAYAGDMVQYNPSFGAPIVMLPAPTKSYEADDIINDMWHVFQDALRRARRVLVLGHSLNDEQIVDAIADLVTPETVGVTVYGHASDPTRPNWEEDPTLGIREEKLPQSTLIPIRFGESNVPAPKLLDEWVQQSR